MQRSTQHTSLNSINRKVSGLFTVLLHLKNEIPLFRRAIALVVILTWAALSLGIKAYAGGDGGIEDNPVIALLSGANLAKDKFIIQSFQPGEDNLPPKIRNIIRVRIKEEYKESIIPSDFIATVKVKIEYGHNAYNEHSIDQTFVVSFKKGAGVKYDAKQYFSFEGAKHVKVTITDHVTPETVGNIPIGDLLSLESEMRVTRYYQLNSGVLPSMFSTSFAPSSAPVPDEMEATWAWPSGAGHTHTQLEWTWLEEGMESVYHNENQVLDESLLFKNNTSRVDLRRGVNSYRIPLLYGGKGHLYCRVRAVNIKTDGTREDGPWSVSRKDLFGGHNGYLNWQAAITFAEDGKRKAMIQYYDGSLRSRQTVTKDNETKTVISSETFYDGQGRPAIQVLPAPASKNINTISYTRGLNLFGKDPALDLPNDQTAEDDPAAFFDLKPINVLGAASRTPALQSRSVAGENGGAAQYYSAANPDKNEELNQNVPDAQGYPYTVTRYTPDATGRVMAQSGVGAEMKMGSGHETKYYYGTPSQEELKALFGTEAGHYTHYFKNMVKDANGQMSVSYLDMYGRTVATALAGMWPGQLSELDMEQYPGQQFQTVSRNLLDKNTNLAKGNSFESVSTLLVPQVNMLQTYTFTYTLIPDKLELSSCANTSLCYNSLYDLEISITDESGENAPKVYKFSNIDASGTCGTNLSLKYVSDATRPENVSISNTEIIINELLEPGSYRIRKTLTLSEASLQKFREEYLTLNKGICETEEQMVENLYATLKSITGCEATSGPDACTACKAALTTLQGDPELYEAAKLSCERLCNEKSQELATKRSLMLADMLPYEGQYRKEGGSGPMFNKYNIPPTSHPESKDPEDVESLLKYHPEFNKLIYAEQHLVPIFDWVQVFRNIPDYSNGIAYLNNSSGALNDPFYNLDDWLIYNPDDGLKKSIVAKINGTDLEYAGGKSMWQIAYGNTVCKTIVNPLERNACYAKPMPSSIDALTGDQKNEVWKLFRILYIMERTKDLNAYLNAKVQLADNGALVDEGYLLRFPKDIKQLTLQFGKQGEAEEWAWFPDLPYQTPTTFPPGTNNGTSVNDGYQSRCSDYIGQWKQSLLECSQLQGHPSKDQILNEITSAMVSICQKGANAANPFGSSTVAPSAPQDGSYRSFEEAILAIFQAHGIALTDLCNPYVIDYPKPYGAGRRLSKEQIAVVESCHCEQFGKLKAEVAASEKNPALYSEFNAYMEATYNEGLTQELFNALKDKCPLLGATTCKEVKEIRTIPVGEMPCGCSDIDDVAENGFVQVECIVGRECLPVGSHFALSAAQPMPAFLKCGFEGNKQCLDCAQLSKLTEQFKQRFPTYSIPVLSQADLTAAQINNHVFYQRFLNFHTGFDYSWVEYLRAARDAQCNLATYATNSGAHQKVICNSSRTLDDPTDVVTIEEPCQRAHDMAVAWSQEQYRVRRQKLLEEFETRYRGKFLEVQQSEAFKVEYTNREYHYTLYYYDRAGNLVKTVPPKGVRPDFVGFNPQHELATDYRYNSLNQIVEQHSPDGGTSKFWYDKVGRLAVSQNAEQVKSNKYSYTRYDELGRVIEVGQKQNSRAMSQTISQDEDDLKYWTNVEAAVKEEVTVTGYDVPFAILQPDFPNGIFAGTELEQHNLRNRVTYTAVKKLGTADVLDYYTATFYNYDVHGNVDRLVQDYKGIPEMSGTNNRYKKVFYDYDLISGKVNGLNYQPGEPDAFYHRYTYDDENRLLKAGTSRDGIEWEWDAAYQYYKHGPLARTELGHLLVQGVDYVYTLQGWLKGVNPASEATSGGDACTPGTAVDNLMVSIRNTSLPAQYIARQSITFEPGFESGTADAFETELNSSLAVCSPAGGSNTVSGNNAYQVAKDAFSYSLHYYKNDYKPIGTNAPGFVQVLAPLEVSGNHGSLYNGNIAAMEVNIPKLGSPLVYAYRYDQLNRLVNMDAYSFWSNNRLMPMDNDQYKEIINYDPNGNILNYYRQGDVGLMDYLVYQYNAGSNQLNRVSDQYGINSRYSNDIDWGISYNYDAIGNLIKEDADINANDREFSWNAYGKMTEVKKSSGDIKYSYDPAGNRITKSSNSITTIYVRDAQGNVLSVYEKEASSGIKQAEVHLYGSSRLGIVGELTKGPETVSLQGGFGSARVSFFTRGEKVMELSNHLGNVLVTVSDKKIAVPSPSDGAFDHYEADLVSASDYSPFGMVLEGRNWNNNVYRYGFNGKENDNEVKGEGNQQDYGMRIYDPRLGRFLSVDPLTRSYPELTPYQFASNTPIKAVDLDGLEASWKPKGQTLGLAQIGSRSESTNQSAASIQRVIKSQEIQVQNQKVQALILSQPKQVLSSDNRTEYQRQQSANAAAERAHDEAISGATMDPASGFHAGIILDDARSTIQAPLVFSAGAVRAYQESDGWGVARNTTGLALSVLPFISKASSGKTIGLGLKEDLANFRRTDAITYLNAGWQVEGLTKVNWGRASIDDYYFRESFKEAANNASAIKFDVTHFNPFHTDPKMTNFEFNHITSNPTLMNKTTFIQNGSEVIWDGKTFNKK
ncbi:RHS repeat-associated core domain-containing protein [Paraflavisolibacter sp. H34]|uniref:RHS repeat-associated core domain-containing protein n=1 Tax=Huijunlia imazamoxiresistens TaxID=3127457 RepID=UPI0030183144